MTELNEHVKRLGDAGEADRIYAAEDIGCANRAEGVRPLLERLPAESSRAVREAIFAALGSIEDDSVTEAAVGLLASEDSFLRNQAVELLRHRGPRAIQFLNRAFPGADRDERKLMLDALAGVDGPGASEVYDQALADGDLNVVITAVENVGHARKVEFRGRIEQLVATTHPMLAGACLETLARIGDAHSLEVVRSRAVAGGFIEDFLLPSYLKMLGAHGAGCDMVEAARMLGSCGARLEASILDAITTLLRRHPSTPLPDLLAEPLQRIVQNSNSSLLRRRALRLLERLTNLDGVVGFLAARQAQDRSAVDVREDCDV